MSIRTDLALAYQMGYDDALGRRRPEPRKAEDMADGTAAENDQLKAVNTELRELVRDMWHEGAFEPGACYEKAAEILEERTRELGIEVCG